MCDCFDEKNVFHINNKSCMEYQTELMKLLLEVAALYCEEGKRKKLKALAIVSLGSNIMYSIEEKF